MTLIHLPVLFAVAFGPKPSPPTPTCAVGWVLQTGKQMRESCDVTCARNKCPASPSTVSHCVDYEQALGADAANSIISSKTGKVFLQCSKADPDTGIAPSFKSPNACYWGTSECADQSFVVQRLCYCSCPDCPRNRKPPGGVVWNLKLPITGRQGTIFVPNGASVQTAMGTKPTDSNTPAPIFVARSVGHTTYYNNVDNPTDPHKNITREGPQTLVVAVIDVPSGRTLWNKTIALCTIKNSSDPSVIFNGHRCLADPGVIYPMTVSPDGSTLLVPVRGRLTGQNCGIKYYGTTFDTMFVFDAATGEEQVAVDTCDTGLTPADLPTTIANAKTFAIDSTYSTDSKTLLLANMYQKCDARCGVPYWPPADPYYSSPQCRVDPASINAQCVQLWVNITAVTLVAPL